MKKCLLSLSFLCLSAPFAFAAGLPKSGKYVNTVSRLSTITISGKEAKFRTLLRFTGNIKSFTPYTRAPKGYAGSYFMTVTSDVGERTFFYFYNKSKSRYIITELNPEADPDSNAAAIVVVEPTASFTLE